MPGPPTETDPAADTTEDPATPPTDTVSEETPPAGDSDAHDSSPTVTETVGVAPAASYTWTTGTVQPAPADTTGETPPTEPPPVDDGAPPPPPPTP